MGEALMSDAKKKIFQVFQEAFPSELSIKEAAKKAGITRETTSKYIAVLAAEGKLKPTRKVGNTKFFTLIPSLNSLVKETQSSILKLEKFIASTGRKSPSLERLQKVFEEVKKEMRSE